MIDVKDLHKRFGENEVLQGITEHIDRGEKVVVPITKEKIKKIFERYYSAANDGSSNIGIGLPLAKAILEKQNGRSLLFLRRVPFPVADLAQPFQQLVLLFLCQHRPVLQSCKHIGIQLSLIHISGRRCTLPPSPIPTAIPCAF